MGLAPTAMDHFAESASIITDSVPVIGNAAICSEAGDIRDIRDFFYPSIFSSCSSSRKSQINLRNKN